MICLLNLHVFINCYIIFSGWFLPIRFSSFFVQWFVSQPHMKNLAPIFQWFLLILPGVLLNLLSLPYLKGMVKLVLLFAFTIKSKYISLINFVRYEYYDKTFLEPGAGKLWCKTTIQLENDSYWMIFLLYRYVFYIKTSILINTSILILWYHLW